MILDLKTFLKSQLAAIAGSIADFLVTILLVQCLHVGIVQANAAGNITGFILLFIISRYWAFQAQEGNLSFQILKFTAFALGNILLSAAGIKFFTQFLKLYYLISKIIISILLGAVYNYFLQKYFVFKA